MKTRVAFLLCFGVAAVAPLRLAAETDRERATALLREIRDSTGTPAVSGAVAARGKLVFSGGAGMIDLENGVAATGSSVYNIGSVSKIVTAVAVLQLVEQGKVRLGDDIRKYVPSFPDKGDTITIRHLLTHTSGIRHYLPTDFPGTPDDENVAPVDWAEGLRFFASDPLLFPPGKYFSYSSYGVNLLQGVVEKASGETFEAYLRKYVWGPGGMSGSGFDIPGDPVPERASSYDVVDGKPVPHPFNDLRYKFASGAMIGSAEDLAKFAAAVNHGVLVRPGTRELMFSDQDRGLRSFQRDGPATSIGFRQGMLWRLHRDPRGRLVAYGCGSVKASNACVVDFVKEDLVAAIATNSWECCGWKKAEALADIFRGPSTTRTGKKPKAPATTSASPR